MSRSTLDVDPPIVGAARLGGATFSYGGAAA